MSKTKCEKLKFGEKYKCDICGKKQTLTRRWSMNPERQLVCPDCHDSELKKGKTLIGL